MVEPIGQKENFNSTRIVDERETHEKSSSRVFEAAIPRDFRDGKPRMLSVGCQFGYEALPFLRMFPEGKYVGIDIDGRVISGAKRIHSGEANVEFREGDARMQANLGEEEWDIVLLRHPQMLGSIMGEGTRKDWDSIVGNSAKAVKPDGIILVTTFLPQEAELAKKALEQGGAHVQKVIQGDPNKREVEDFIIIVGKKT